jgi:dTDP-4-amino-4,6-dideoxygalactose transaminase
VAIPLLDLKRVHAPILDDLAAAARQVLETGQFILGPHVTAFEEEVAAYLGVAHAIGVSSGTDALRAVLAVLAMNRGKGKVLTTPYTFIATAEAICQAGLEPVFVDVDVNTGLLDLDLLPEDGSGIVGIVPVHLFGQCVDMDRLLAYARDRDLWVVEDTAQSFGATWRGVQSGALGTAGCFSFFPSKNLGGAGDGGLITTQDDELARYLRAARAHGVLSQKYYSDFLSGNYRLDAMQAALLRVKLPHIDAWNGARQAVADVYQALWEQSGLLRKGLVRPLGLASGSSHVFHQYVIRVACRDEVAAALTAARIGNAVYYPAPLHLQQAFAWMGHTPESFPAAMELARTSLALPVFPGLTESEQEAVVACVHEVLMAQGEGECIC